MVLNKNLVFPSTWELINVKKTRLEWNSKTPLQKWCYLCSIANVSAAIIGLTVYDDDEFHWRWRAYGFFSYVALNTTLAIYTAFCSLNDEQFYKFLPCKIIVAVLICSTPLVWTGVNKSRNFFSLIVFSGKYIYPDCQEDGEYNRICSKHIDSTVRSFFIKITILILAASVGVVQQIYVYYSDAMKTTLISVRIPFTDEYSNDEFFANAAMTAFICCYGLSAYICAESIISLMNDVVILTPKLVEIEFKKLDDQLKNKSLNKAEFVHTFHSIVKQCLDADDYIVEIGNIFYGRTLLTPPCMVYCVGMSIFCQYTKGFAVGYAMAILSYVQFFYLSEFGEEIEDNGFDEMLCKTNWYNLPVKYQIDFSLLINRKQNGNCICMGPFGIINRELFQIMTKKIYSFVMFLKNFSVKN